MHRSIEAAIAADTLHFRQRRRFSNSDWRPVMLRNSPEHRLSSHFTGFGCHRYRDDAATFVTAASYASYRSPAYFESSLRRQNIYRNLIEIFRERYRISRVFGH